MAELSCPEMVRQAFAVREGNEARDLLWRWFSAVHPMHPDPTLNRETGEFLARIQGQALSDRELVEQHHADQETKRSEAWDKWKAEQDAKADRWGL